MSLLLHAILDADASNAGEPGLARIATDRLAAWATISDTRALGRADMLAHHELVATLHEHSTACLPARFPTLFGDPDALRAMLLEREVELCAALERVRGCAELAVTALWIARAEPPAISETTPGRRYLLQRQQVFHSADEQRATANAIADRIEHVLGAQLVDAQRKICPRPETALSLALLVRRATAPILEANLAATDQGRDVRILLNGPWPPYTFATVPVKEE